MLQLIGLLNSFLHGPAAQLDVWCPYQFTSVWRSGISVLDNFGVGFSNSVFVKKKENSLRYRFLFRSLRQSYATGRQLGGRRAIAYKSELPPQEAAQKGWGSDTLGIAKKKNFEGENLTKSIEYTPCILFKLMF